MGRSVCKSIGGIPVAMTFMMAVEVRVHMVAWTVSHEGAINMEFEAVVRALVAGQVVAGAVGQIACPSEMDEDGY